MPDARPEWAGEGVPAHVIEARQRGELVVDAAMVTAAVDQLSVRLSVDLCDANPLLLAVMHGALPLVGRLLQRLNFALEVGCLHVGRYGHATEGGTLRWHADPEYAVGGRTVLIVDDILDRGNTLAELVSWARAGSAARVLTAVLVDKQVSHPRQVEADYVALSCPDRYLFGCGMDYCGYWRNLPAIYALPADLEKQS